MRSSQFGLFRPVESYQNGGQAAMGPEKREINAGLNEGIMLVIVKFIINLNYLNDQETFSWLAS